MLIQPLVRRYASKKGNGLSAEINDIVSYIEDGFGNIFIKQYFHIVDDLYHSPELHLPVQNRRQFIDLPRLNKGLIALNIDDVIKGATAKCIGFITTIGSTPMVGRGHNDVPSKTKYMLFNSGIIRCNDNFADPSCFFDLLIDPTNHAFPTYINQCFSWKSNRSVASRDNTEYFCVCQCSLFSF